MHPRPDVVFGLSFLCGSWPIFYRHSFKFPVHSLCCWHVLIAKMLLVLTRWKQNARCFVMKLSLSTATAETTTFPNHRQTKQLLIILPNNGWDEIQIPWPSKVTCRTWTRIKCRFFSQTNPLGTGWTWSQSNPPPQEHASTLVFCCQKPIQKHFHTISSVCHFVCRSDIKMWFFLTFTWMIQALKSLRCSRYTYQETRHR